MSTPDQVDLYFTYKVKDGEDAQYEKYLNLVPPLTEAQEPYVLEYEISRRDDGTYLQHERYEDEAAMNKHLEVTAEGQKVWGDATELIDLKVVGKVSQAYWDTYAAPNVTGFARVTEIAR